MVNDSVLSGSREERFNFLILLSLISADAPNCRMDVLRKKWSQITLRFAIGSKVESFFSFTTVDAEQDNAVRVSVAASVVFATSEKDFVALNGKTTASKLSFNVRGNHFANFTTEGVVIRHIGTVNCSIILPVLKM